MIYQLTEEQLKDYIRCPVFYRLKYDDNKLEVTEPVTMTKLLNQIFTGFCVGLMDGKVTRPDILKRRWDMLANRYPEYLNGNRVREGIGKIYQFYRWAESCQLRVADVGSPYILHIKDGADYLEYHGMLGIVAANVNNDPENLIINSSNRFPDQTDLDLSLKITLDHLGFYHNTKLKFAGTRIHHLKGNRDFFTTRDLALHQPRAKQIILNVAHAIRQKIWFPHEDPLCPSCTVRDFCLGFGME